MSLIQEYLEYTSDSESPTVFHRWSLITGLSALVRRNVFMRHGSAQIYPNLYSMLVGDPGARKSTAIKTMKRLMQASGYTTIAADKTTKEKFLLDLQEQQNPNAHMDKKDEQLVHWIEASLEGASQSEEFAPACMLVAADEFNDFTGNGNIEFYSTLGVLWDISGPYSSRIKNGKSVTVLDPTVSILAGNTPAGIALAFPPEVLGQGFLSRLLLIYGESNGRRITFPKNPDDAATKSIVAQFRELQNFKAEITYSAEALETVNLLYQQWIDLPDARFRSYSTRRLTQFFKVACILCAARGSRIAELQDVVEANTFLSAIELRMPAALGEYGKSKNSDVAQKIVKILAESVKPVTAKQLWKDVHNDLESLQELVKLLQNLKEADKIQYVAEGAGFLPKIQPVEATRDLADLRGNKSHMQFVDWRLLSEQERHFYNIF